MFYKLTFDMERIDKAIEDGTNTIYAEASNLNEIEYSGMKKGFFDNVILSNREISEEGWPNVEFYYSSLASDIKNEYLLNIKRWPIIHKKVKEEFEKEKIKGIQYLPIKLIDVVSNNINEDYVLMYIVNFIDAYDMKKSQYKYNEKYDFYNFLPRDIILDESVCSKYDIFRCNKNVVAIYVSERIKTMVEDNHWIGFEFSLMKTNKE